MAEACQAAPGPQERSLATANRPRNPLREIRTPLREGNLLQETHTAKQALDSLSQVPGDPWLPIISLQHQGLPKKT